MKFKDAAIGMALTGVSSAIDGELQSRKDAELVRRDNLTASRAQVFETLKQRNRIDLEATKQTDRMELATLKQGGKVENKLSTPLYSQAGSPLISQQGVNDHLAGGGQAFRYPPSRTTEASSGGLSEVKVAKQRTDIKKRMDDYNQNNPLKTQYSDPQTFAQEQEPWNAKLVGWEAGFAVPEPNPGGIDSPEQVAVVNRFSPKKKVLTKTGANQGKENVTAMPVKTNESEDVVRPLPLDTQTGQAISMPTLSAQQIPAGDTTTDIPGQTFRQKVWDEFGGSGFDRASGRRDAAASFIAKIFNGSLDISDILKGKSKVAPSQKKGELMAAAQEVARIQGWTEAHLKEVLTEISKGTPESLQSAIDTIHANTKQQG